MINYLNFQIQSLQNRLISVSHSRTARSLNTRRLPVTKYAEVARRVAFHGRYQVLPRNCCEIPVGCTAKMKLKPEKQVNNAAKETGHKDVSLIQFEICGISNDDTTIR